MDETVDHILVLYDFDLNGIVDVGASFKLTWKYSYEEGKEIWTDISTFANAVLIDEDENSIYEKTLKDLDDNGYLETLDYDLRNSKYEKNFNYEQNKEDGEKL